MQLIIQTPKAISRNFRILSWAIHQTVRRSKPRRKSLGPPRRRPTENELWGPPANWRGNNSGHDDHGLVIFSTLHALREKRKEEEGGREEAAKYNQPSIHTAIPTMSFSFFKQSRPKTPPELVKAIKDSLLALDTKTVVEVKALKMALEEVEKNFVAMRIMLCGDGEAEPNEDQVSQFTLESCKEDLLGLFIHKLPTLGWEARKDLVYSWSILLRQNVDSSYCCVDYLENHMELLDFLVVSYDNKDIALTCGSMLRECIKYPTLTKYILESRSFELFFKYVELPNFDVASDAFSTFKDLLTKHETPVSEFLTIHYEQFFELYERLLTSTNYVTRRQSLKLLSEFLLESPNSQIMKRYILEVRYLKVMMTLLQDSRKNIQISAFHIFKVFVANPNKPPEIVNILVKNHEKLQTLLESLSVAKGSEDEQLDEEKELIIKEIRRISHLSHAAH